ncbi:rod shape-determining protein MreC [Flavobacterium croceum]|nr:rod shape-determining protein MreC [Flavobacterium croceum]
MQQIFLFLIKNSYRMLFLLLMGIAITLTIQSHSYHKSKVISSANFVSGGVYSQMNRVSDYFSLQTQNEELAKENARLKSLLFNQKDTAKIVLNDSIKGVKKTDLIISKVIKNSYSNQENILTINSGSNQGVKPYMGVINSLGIVGIIDQTSSNYATVVSILNTSSKITAKLKKNNHFGTLTWNGKNTGYVQLYDLPRLATVRKGDTIVTYGENTIFPENINIGTVDKVYIDNETTSFTIQVKLFNDMTSLGHVYVINNKDADELRNLEKQSKKEKHE